MALGGGASATWCGIKLGGDPLKWGYKIILKNYIHYIVIYTKN